MNVNDGDKALVVQDDTLTYVAKRETEGIVPLYYEMSKAKDTPITSDKLYEALTSAYKANIGIISNEITKIWNSSNPDIDSIKWLCLLNNFIIDYAKTLFMPTKPLHVDEQLKVFSRMKLPHFFKYAKDKEDGQIDSINESTVNKLYNIIPNKPIQFKKLFGKVDYKMLMRNKRVIENQDIIDKFTEINRNKRFLINQNEVNDDSFNNYLMNELLLISNNESYIVDVLVSHLFKKDSKSKETLWKCYGEVIYNNLLINLGDTISCSRCNKRTEKISNRQEYCNECSIIIKKEKTKERVSRHRNK